MRRALTDTLIGGLSPDRWGKSPRCCGLLTAAPAAPPDAMAAGRQAHGQPGGSAAPWTGPAPRAARTAGRPPGGPRRSAGTVASAAPPCPAPPCRGLAWGTRGAGWGGWVAGGPVSGGGRGELFAEHCRRDAVGAALLERGRVLHWHLHTAAGAPTKRTPATYTSGWAHGMQGVAAFATFATPSSLLSTYNILARGTGS